MPLERLGCCPDLRPLPRSPFDIKQNRITILYALQIFGRLLADYAGELINLYSLDVTSLAALLSFLALETLTLYTRP